MASRADELAPTRDAARRRTLRLAAAAALVGFAIVLWGGYDRNWSWTGLHHATTLWDWLELLMLPLAFALVPLWLDEEHDIHRTRIRVLSLAGAAFAVLVAVGYGFNVGWTGFPDNKLWDWLTLLALPLVIGTFPLWPGLRARWGARHWTILGIVLAAFVVVAIGGYAWNWKWTGFSDNKLWDWLHLLLLPVLIPILLVPLAESWMKTPPRPGESRAPAPPP